MYDTAKTESMFYSAMEMLPCDMAKAADAAYKAVTELERCEPDKALSYLKAFRRSSGEAGAAYYFHKARAELMILERLSSHSPEQAYYLRAARRDFSKFLSLHSGDSKCEMRLYASIEKARLDYIAGHRKGIFMGIIEAPDSDEIVQAISGSINMKGLKAIYHSDNGLLFMTKSGSIIGADLNRLPSLQSGSRSDNLILIIAITGESGAVETAERFIEAAYSIMKDVGSDTIYINGTVLTADDVKEAVTDIASDAFPIWFFARGMEDDDGDSFSYTAEGASSFGVKTIVIENVPAARRADAASALSVILMLYIYSPSSRNEDIFTFEGTRYRKVSSDASRIVFHMEE